MAKKLIYIQSGLIAIIFGMWGVMLIDFTFKTMMIPGGIVIGGLIVGLLGGNFVFHMYSAVSKVTERCVRQNTELEKPEND